MEEVTSVLLPGRGVLRSDWKHHTFPHLSSFWLQQRPLTSDLRGAAPDDQSQLLLEASESSPPPVDLQELSEEIEDYTQRFNTEDQLEWSLVLQEVAAFVEVSLSLHIQAWTRPP